MFKSLLLPLDGSHLAESVFPVASYMAKALNASVTLLHVIEKNAPEEIHGDIHLSEPQKADAYLEKVSKHELFNTLHIERHVHSSEVGDVAKSIAEHSVEFQNDLIVICSHGSGGVRDALFGSIAQQIISLGKKPVLIVQPFEAEKKEGKISFSCQDILIALDGHPEHEQALSIAADLAQVCGAVLHLLMVVPTFGTMSIELSAVGRLLPGTTSRMLDMGEQNAEEYLNKHKEELAKRGISVVTDVFRGDPVDVIVNSAQEKEVDLIIMGTHGKIGTEAFWSGSVAPKICKRCKIGLLHVPVVKEEKDP